MTEFRLATGISIDHFKGVKEGYSVVETEQGYSEITVNVSAENLMEMVLMLAREVRTPAFVVLEVPTNEREEESLRENADDPLHRDVYYWDGVEFAQFDRLLHRYARFFVEDGALTFGFGSHEGYDEVFVGKFKILSIFTDEPKKYMQKLKAAGYERREPLVTVWDSVSPENPAVTRTITINGETIYEMVEELEEAGFYFAERRPD